MATELLNETRGLQNKYIQFLRNYNLSEGEEVVIYVDIVLGVNYTLRPGGELVQRKVDEVIQEKGPVKEPSKITIDSFATLYGINGLKDAVERIIEHETYKEKKKK